MSIKQGQLLKCHICPILVLFLYLHFTFIIIILIPIGEAKIDEVTVEAHPLAECLDHAMINHADYEMHADAKDKNVFNYFVYLLIITSYFFDILQIFRIKL